MHWSNHGWGMGYGWGMGLGWLLMIIFWVLIVLGVAYIVRLFAGSMRKEEKDVSAIDILRKRYAKGEITREEFQKMKDDIKKE